MSAEGGEPEVSFDDMAYLSISVRSTGCATQDGPLGGFPGMEGFTSVTVGDAQVEISSTLGEADLATVTASLRPVTVDDLAASIPEWAGEGILGGFSPGMLGL